LLLISLLIYQVQGNAQTCTLSTSPVLFGGYNPFNATATDSTGSVSVTCVAAISLFVNYTIKLDGGLGGSIATRRMTAGGTQLFYQLYDSSGRTTVWGDGTGGSVSRSDGYLLQILTPVVKTYTAYGRITARQNVGPGAYSDAVTVLLTY
jgi:spore coat protein U-like protein